MLSAHSGGFEMEMFTIQRNYWKDLGYAKEKIQFSKGKNPSAPKLYRAIAGYLGIYTSDIPVAATKEDQKLEVAAIADRIDEKNAELACVGVAESMVEREATIVDKMAAKIEPNRPVLRRDRKPTPKPVKTIIKPVVRKLPPTSVMAKALARGGLVIVR
jgi:hypothetical protein